MPRIRTIKPQFWDSPSTAKASAVARLAYIAMWNWADDYGRGTANLKELEGFIFPNDDVYELSSGNARYFRDIVAEVSECFGVVFYTSGGRPYYAIPAWDEHQRNERRAKDSKYPAPDAEGSVITPMTRTNNSKTGGGAEHARYFRDPVAEAPQSSGLGIGEEGKRGRGEQYLSSSPCEDSSSRDSDSPSTGSDSSAQRPDARPTEYPPAFEDWWKTYPRRRNASKKDAAKQWREATKTIAPEELLRLTSVYADNPGVDDARYIPHPHKWLKDRRWEAIEETDNPATPHSRFTPEAIAGRFYGTSQPEIVDAEVLPWQLEA